MACRLLVFSLINYYIIVTANTYIDAQYHVDIEYQLLVFLSFIESKNFATCEQ